MEGREGSVVLRVRNCHKLRLNSKTFGQHKLSIPEDRKSTKQEGRKAGVGGEGRSAVGEVPRTQGACESQLSS